MTDQHQAIAALIEAIEAGDGISIGDVGEVSSLNAREILTVMNAYKGSLDAALSLQEALLPGWFPGVSQNIHTGYWYAWVQDKVTHHFSATEADRARAILIAILKAYASQLSPASNRKGAAE